MRSKISSSRWLQRQSWRSTLRPHSEAALSMAHKLVRSLGKFRATGSRAILVAIRTILVIPAALVLLTSFVFLAGSEAVAAETAKAPEIAKAPEASEAESEISYGAEIEVNSRYIWHGIPYSEGGVVQPSIWLSRNGFTFTVWANSPLSNHSFLSRWDEIDLTLSYEKQFGKLTVEPCFNYYLYPGVQDCPPTGELAVKFSYPLRGSLAGFTTHTFDVVEYGGSYFGEAGVEYERALGPRTSWASSIGIGWGSERFNQTYIGPNKGALNVAAFDVSLTYRLNEAAYLRTHIGFSSILDRTLRRGLTDPDNLIVGLAAGFEF
jgi:hypothetical protein